MEQLKTIDQRNVVNTFGKSKKLDWFTAENLERGLMGDILEIQKFSGRELRATLQSIFAGIQYEYRDEYKNTKNLFTDLHTFQDCFMRRFGNIKYFVREYGFPKTIPQRAFIFLSQLNELVKKDMKSIRLVEFGAAAGLLGSIFEYPEHYLQKFSRDLFWVNESKIPQTPHFEINYEGYDLHIIKTSLVPYFIWNDDHRERVENFITLARRPRHLKEEDLFKVLAREINSNELLDGVFFMTSFMLYQLSLEQKQEFLRLMQKCQARGATWLDLSRHHHDIPWLKSFSPGLVYNHNYFSVNGIPQKEIIEGSDDCKNWKDLDLSVGNY